MEVWSANSLLNMKATIGLACSYSAPFVSTDLDRAPRQPVQGWSTHTGYQNSREANTSNDRHWRRSARRRGYRCLLPAHLTSDLFRTCRARPGRVTKAKTNITRIEQGGPCRKRTHEYMVCIHVQLCCLYCTCTLHDLLEKYGKARTQWEPDRAIFHDAESSLHYAKTPPVQVRAVVLLL